MPQVTEPVLELLRERLRKEMNNWQDNIADGTCENFADYKYKAGVIWGLMLAERELFDLSEKLEND